MKSDKTKSGKKKKERDPSAPKRARTAFNFFLDEFRVEYKKTNPEAKGVVEVTQSGSAKWKVMSPKEKEPFETKALEARAKYQKDKEEYERAGGQAKFKLRQAPPRPPTAYFMFLGHFRKEFKLKNPEVKGIKDMSKEAGAPSLLPRLPFLSRPAQPISHIHDIRREATHESAEARPDSP